MHPYEAQVLARRDLEQDVDRHCVDLDACLAVGRTGYYRAVGHHCEVPDAVLQSLLWTGTGCFPVLVQLVSALVLVPICLRLVLA